MAHFAEIDSNNKVVRVLVVSDADAVNGHDFLANKLGLGGTWVQTSYNTLGGVHYGSDGKPDNGTQIGFNYAGIGYTWDGTGFAAPQPYPSWTLDKTTYFWNAPVAAPTLDRTKYPDNMQIVTWNEDTKAWDFTQPFPSWTQDATTKFWTAPVAYPTDGKSYFWNEETKVWTEVPAAPQA